jgi:acyl carrier protein
VASRYVAPRTPVEAQVAAIWAEVLGVAQVGVEDNFFELGGHSLLATQVIYKVQEAFHVELPLERLFDTPTIESVAMIIVQGQLERQGLEKASELFKRLEALTEDEVKALINEEMKSLQGAGER